MHDYITQTLLLSKTSVRSTFRKSRLLALRYRHLASLNIFDAKQQGMKPQRRIVEADNKNAIMTPNDQYQA